MPAPRALGEQESSGVYSVRIDSGKRIVTQDTKKCLNGGGKNHVSAQRFQQQGTVTNPQQGTMKHIRGNERRRGYAPRGTKDKKLKGPSNVGNETHPSQKVLRDEFGGGDRWLHPLASNTQTQRN